MPATPLITTESIRAHLNEATSRAVLLRAIGVTQSSRNYARLEQVAEDSGILLPPKNNNGKSGIRRHLRTADFWDAETLRVAVTGAKSLGEVVDRLGLTRNAIPRIQLAAQEFGIELPRGQGGPDPELARQQAIARTFRKGTRRVSGVRLKRYILHLGVMPYVCSLCDQKPFWNGKPLVLEVDHENGDSSDNRQENLRFLCPNCHSQTETFAGRNRGKAMGNGVTGNTPGFGPGDDFVHPGSSPGSPAPVET